MIQNDVRPDLDVNDDLALRALHLQLADPLLLDCKARKRLAKNLHVWGPDQQRQLVKGMINSTRRSPKYVRGSPTTEPCDGPEEGVDEENDVVGVDVGKA